jgi:hypothetical protein
MDFYLSVLVFQRYCKKGDPSLVNGATLQQIDPEVIQYILPTPPEDNQYPGKKSEGICNTLTNTICANARDANTSEELFRGLPISSDPL